MPPIWPQSASAFANPRKRRGMSRRTLAHDSGVSERYHSHRWNRAGQCFDRL
jgi:hypothetical protein